MALICGQADIIIILEPAAGERKGSGRLYQCFKCDKMISGQSGSGQRRGREEGGGEGSGACGERGVGGSGVSEEGCCYL